MLALVLRVLFDARIASHVGAVMAGEPELGPVLERICVREAPHCQLRGIHQRDRHMERSLGPGMSTRGAWGTVAAYTVMHLPLGLRAPYWLDVPLLGAYAAAKRASSPACNRAPGCRSWLGVG